MSSFCSNEAFESFMNNGGSGIIRAVMKSFKKSGDEDLFQELSLETAKAIMSYDPEMETELGEWVKQCCTRAMFMMVSRINASCPERNQEKRKAKCLLGKILQDAELAPLQRHIVEQTLNGMSQVEIAKELNCPQTKISKMYRETLDILRGTDAARAAMAV